MLNNEDRKIKESSTGILDFWNRAHDKGRSFWTSGTPFNEIIDFFNLYVDPNFKKGKKVLVVGVGQGTEIDGFKSLQFDVSGLDIVDDLDKKFNTTIYSYSNLRGRYDLIVMHLVAQHMDDFTLRNAFNLLNHHLKESGSLFVQFAISFGEHLKSDQSISLQKNGSITRIYSEINDIAFKSNLIISEFNIKRYYPEYGMCHASVLFHKVKKHLKIA